MIKYKTMTTKNKWKVTFGLLNLFHINETYKAVVLATIFLSIIADILIVADGSDFRIYGILALYILGILFYKLNSSTTFRLALVLLALMFIEFIFTGTSQKTEKAAVWLFFFVAIGIIQQFKEK